MPENKKNPSSNESAQDLNAQLKTIGNRTFLIFSLFFFAVLLAISIWGIVPKFNQITADRAQLLMKKTTLEEITSKANQINTILSESNYNQQVQLVDNILYSTNPFMETLSVLSTVSKDNEINFTSFEYSPGLIATPSAQFNTSANSAAARSLSAQQNQGFTIYLETNGSYINTLNFINQIENSAPFMSVTYAEINNSLLGYVSAEFEIFATYYKPNIIARLDESLPLISQAQNQLLQSTLQQFTLPDFSSNQKEFASSSNNIFGVAIQQHAAENELDSDIKNETDILESQTTTQENNTLAPTGVPLEDTVQ